jgi:hypothetical protein
MSSNSPSQFWENAQAYRYMYNAAEGYHSVGVYPGTHQPSGHLNFSRANEFYIRIGDKTKDKNTTSKGVNNYALGIENHIEGNMNFILGEKNKIYGNNNHIQGNTNFVLGDCNRIRGNNNKVFALSPIDIAMNNGKINQLVEFAIFKNSYGEELGLYDLVFDYLV